MKINTILMPIIHYPDVDVLAIIEVKNPRKTHQCHECHMSITTRHLKVVMNQMGTFFEIRECMNCYHRKDKEAGRPDIGYSVIIKEER